MSELITDPIEQLASRCEVPVEWLRQWADEYGVRLGSGTPGAIDASQEETNGQATSNHD